MSPDFDRDRVLRDQTAVQLDELMSGALATNGSRAAAMLAERMPQGRPTPTRLATWREIERQYRARQPDVAREGRAALLTAGAPGAGKSTAVTELNLIDERWRRLDADVVKDFLVDELVRSGEVDDVLRVELEDGRPVMPRELAGLVHAESVAILDLMRRRALREGENVVIEGTLGTTAHPFRHSVCARNARSPRPRSRRPRRSPVGCRTTHWATAVVRWTPLIVIDLDRCSPGTGGPPRGRPRAGVGAGREAAAPGPHR